jgi:CP12 domain
MRLTLILVSSFVTTALGLVPGDLRRPSSKTARLSKVASSVRPDSSDAIQEALRISKEHGATSVEARVAWETVEEMDASDFSPAFASATMTTAGSDGSTSGEKRETDYAHQVSSLAYLLHDTHEKIDQIKQLVASIKALELDDPSLAKLGAAGGSHDLKVALRESKAAVDLYGPGSREADEAWSRVEECASADADDEGCSVDTLYRYSAAAIKAHHLYDAVIDSSLLQAAMDGIGTLERLRSSIQIENQRLQNPR